MTTTKYIRPMSFWETVSIMYRLYVKTMIPVFLFNVTTGAFLFSDLVGPSVIITSNVILGKPLKLLASTWKGIFSLAVLKIAVSSIIYLILIGVSALVINAFSRNPSFYLYMEILFYFYLIFLPIWIFIPIIILLEKKGLRVSTTRSFQIIRKNFSRTLQMDIFVTVVFTVIAMLFSTVVPPPTTADSISPFALGLLASSSLFALSGFLALPYVIVYYEYRARYENYSEELLAQELGYQPMEEMMTV